MRPSEHEPERPPSPAEEGTGRGPTGSGGAERLAGVLLSGLGRVSAAVVGLLFLTTASAVLLASQTTAGRSVVAGLVEGALSGAVDGRVQVGPITGGNLVTRVLLDRFRIADREGRVLVDLSGVRVEYSPLSLLAGRYHFRRLSADRMEVVLRQDESGVWNFDRIFGGGEEEDDGDEDDGGGGATVLATDVTSRGGRLEILTPWSGPPPGAGQAGGEGDETDPPAIWRHERRGGEDLRVLSLNGLSGSFPVLRLAHPRRPMHLELRGVSTRAEVVRQPLSVRSLTGSATFGDTVRVDVDHLETPGSRLGGGGRVVPADHTRYRFELAAEPVAFGDLRWLPVPVPDSGTASGQLWLEDEGRGLTVGMAGAELRSGDSRVTGSFTLDTGPPPGFRDLDLELRPLRLRLVRELTGLEAEVDGYASGSVRGSGPLDMLQMEANLELQPLPGATVADGEGEEPSRIRLRGGVDLEGGGALRALEMELDGFRPAWTEVLGLELRQRGRVDGSLTLDRARGGPLAFAGDLRLRAAGDTTSHVNGRGTVILAGREPRQSSGRDRPTADDTARDRARMNVTLNADPLSLSVLDPYFPRLRLVGVVRGDLSASGTLDDLRAEADLATPRGALTFDGRFDLLAERRTYDVALTARDIQLRQWMERGPSTDLDVQGRVRGSGTTPDSLEATFDLEVLPSRFHGARVDSSRLRFTVERGLARVDTFAVRTELGAVTGRGAFGLAAERSGSLVLTADAPNLARWNRWLLAAREGSDGDAPDDALFRRLGGADPIDDEETAAPDTLAGSLSARGVLYGNVSRYGFGGSVRAADVRYGSSSADSVTLTLDVADASSRDSLVVAGTASGVRRGGVGADSVRFRVERRGRRQADLSVFARRDTSARLAATASLEWTDGRRTALVDSLELGLGSHSLRLEERARVAYGDSGLSVEGLRMTGERGERLAASGKLPRAGEADFSLEVADLPLDEVGDFVALAPELEGVLSGSAAVAGTADDPRMEARLTVSGPGFESLDYGELRADVRYEGRRLRGDVALRAGGRDAMTLGGEVRADLSLGTVERRLLDDPLDLTLRADSLPARFLQLPLEGVHDVGGVLRGRVGITGTPGAPRFDGQIELEGGSARMVSLGVRYVRVGGTVSFDGSEARVDSLGFASTRGGRGRIRGTVDLASFSDPGLDLRFEARRLRAIDRRKISLVVNGNGRLAGSYGRPTLTGEFRLSDGTVRMEEFARERSVVDLSDPEVYGLVDPAVLEERRLVARARNPFLQNLRADVGLQVGPDMWLRGSRLEVELAGDLELRMDRAQEQLAVYGSLTLPRGSFTYRQGIYSRELKLSEGQLEFVGTPGIDPNLDVTATHQTRGRQGTLVVRAQVTGTLSAPRVAFTSEPPMSESDQICVLLFNAPCVLAQGSAGRLMAQRGLGVIGSELFSSLVGGQVVDYVQVRSGGPGREQTGDGNGEEEDQGQSLLGQTEVEVGKYLTPELFLTVTQPLGTPLPTMSLDWRFAEHWSMEVRSEYRFGQDFLGTGGSSNIARDRTWGLFLFREWSF